MITSAALGKITVGPGDDPAVVWDQLRALVAGSGLPPLAAVRLALAAVELIGSPQGQASVEVAAVSGEGGARVQAVVHGGSGRGDGPAARLADLCRPHPSASGAAGQMVVLDPRRGVHGVIALAWRRRLRAADGTDPRLRAFAEAWLGRGAG